MSQLLPSWSYYMEDFDCRSILVDSGTIVQWRSINSCPMSTDARSYNYSGSLPAISEHHKSKKNRLIEVSSVLFALYFTPCGCLQFVSQRWNMFSFNVVPGNTYFSQIFWEGVWTFRAAVYLLFFRQVNQNCRNIKSPAVARLTSIPDPSFQCVKNPICRSGFVTLDFVTLDWGNQIGISDLSVGEAS